MADLYGGFGAGPVYRGANRDEQIAAAFDMPMNLGATFWDQAKGGVLESFGLGTAIRDFSIPDGRVPEGDAQSRYMDAEESAMNPVVGLYRGAKRLIQGEDESPSLPEEGYKTSKWFRSDNPWDEGMTEARAAALASWYDAKKVREYFSSKRPITSFFGGIAGQALDPINYVPVVGPVVRAAAVARVGRIGGVAASSALDAAGNTALFGALTRGTREDFGDDVSWQATVSEIATAALIGSAFGGILGSIDVVRGNRASARAQADLQTLRTTQEARIALNEAIDAVVRGEPVALSPNATDAITRAAESRQDQIARIVDEDVPVGAAPRRPVTLMQFLASSGGIAEDAGELAAMGLSRKFVPGAGALVRRSGNRLDDARALAAEAGYFDDQYGPELAVDKSTVDDLLRLIRREASGEPAYAPRLDGGRVYDAQEYEARLMDNERYRRLLDEIDTAARDLGIDHKLDDNVLREATDLIERGDDPVTALEQAIEQDYRAFYDSFSERSDVASLSDIPFFEDAGAVRGGGGSVDATGGNGGPGRRSGNAPDRQQLRDPVDAETQGRLADSRSRLGKAETPKTLAAQHNVDVNTGTFPEIAEVEQLRLEGRLTEDDIAELDAADQVVADADAYGEALKAVTRCLL